jgi:DNA-binding CsgD family transcriptional regulator/tetratricopeptide (TPR) repeat protein
LLEALAGDLLEWLDECLASGMVVAARGAVTFRHELARLAIEESLGPHHLVALHRSALEALRRRSPDPARLAHHAEMAGDGAAVLEFAPAAARRAASAGAHREAAAQYARAVRFADGGLGLSERGELLERLSEELSMIAEQQDAVSAASAAVDCYRTLGDRRKQANALCTLARCLYCPGESIGGAHQAAREAVEVLEDEPPCRELARAYALMAAVSMNAEDVDRAFEWGPRAVELAERLGDQDILVYALNDLGTIEYLTGAPGGRERLERSLRLALEAGFEAHAARAYVHLAWVATRIREYGVAAHYVREGIAYCTERDLDMYRHYLFTRRAQLELGRGQWDEAAESAMLVADDPRSGPDARAPAFAVLALVRARRGDPDHAPVLEQAIALAESGDLQRTGPVAAARAEILWLERRLDQIDQATRPTLELSVRCKAPWMAGELAYWRWRAGLRDELPAELIAEPYRLSIAGDWAPAADLWNQIGCPYEAALALAESQDQHAVSQAIEQLQQLGAPPPAAIFARRLRERGVRGVPRGPRPGTRENPAGLTARELEVLELLAEGLANAQIAERLVVSRKTVDHHVSAILRKLNARTRGEASAHASRLGIASPR